MIQIAYNIPTNVLKAAILHAPTKDIRYYLNSVLIEFCGPEKAHAVYIVATDGATAFISNHPPAEGVVPPLQLIIPVDAAKTAVKGAGKASTITLTYNSDGPCSLGQTLFTPVDARYPDWRRVVPKEVSGEPCDFDFSLLNRCQESLRAFTEKKNSVFKLEMNGTGAA